MGKKSQNLYSKQHTINQLKLDTDTIFNNLAQTFIEFSKSQIEYWKQIPYLYLLTDGKFGYNDQFYTIMKGYKPITNYLYVDLDNGNIVGGNKFEHVKNKTFFSFVNLYDLDAEKIVNLLKKKECEPCDIYRKEMFLHSIKDRQKEFFYIKRMFNRTDIPLIKNSNLD